MNLTDKGKKYGSTENSINITFEKFDRIVKVSQDRDNATVLFTVKNEKSPFFNLFECSDCPKNTEKKEVRLTKFDTGWVLSKK